MKALVYNGPGQRSWREMSDPVIQDPEDAIVRVDAVTICGTANGLSTSRLNQAIEHDTLRWLVHDPLGIWTRPQAVVRFGYGPPVPPTDQRCTAAVVRR